MKKTETTDRINRTILGVDPGTVIMGYAIVCSKGSSLELLIMGVIELKKYKSHYDKLSRIYERVDSIIKEYKPEELAIESPFFGKNVQSMLKLGRAQGVAMAAALSNGLPIFEYAPKKIKTAITGSGSASKEQVAKVLKMELRIEDMPEYMDATDALGAAVCHFHQTRLIGPAAKQGGNDWKSFIRNNPGRVRE
ncbi:MAG: crossover junction endodeoxyribonuclease RuvC [Prevotellaceae bacterium]|jgi:crossover junction endodeoxyribonuclease RuvC|nr:crossover junction endodeoxyribonuclease RuvC [Prevotellaceae bacterium]